MNEDTRAELDRLLNDLLSDRLETDAAKRLEGLLSENAEARKQYYLFLDIDAALRRARSVDEGIEILREPDGELTAPARHDSRHRVAWRSTGFLGLLTAIAAVIAFMLYDSPGEHERQIAASGHDSVQLVATVVRMNGVVGRSELGPLSIRQRIPTGSVQLTSGRMMLQLDNGARLNVEGPANIEIVSLSKVRLQRGEVSVYCPASALGFELEAPDVSVVDLGTEFGMNATLGGTDIHVFDGEVAWRSLSGEETPRLLESGSAVRLTSAGSETIPFEDDSFQRDYSFPDHVEHDGEERILCYEGFAYGAGQLGLSDGGGGWAQGWRRANTDKPIGFTVLGDGDLQRDEDSASGARLELKGFKRAWRQILEPVRMDRNGSTYVSFQLRKTGLDNPVDPVTATVVLGSDRHPNAMVGVGVNESDHFFLLHSGHNQVVPETIVEDVTYLIVVRIESRETLPDELSGILLHAGDAVPQSEPVTWPHRGASRSGDESLNHLIVQNKRGAIFELDEIRIGTSWQSVTRVD